MTNEHKTLISLTRDTSGVIYFPQDGIAYAVDWSDITGFPRILVRESGLCRISSSEMEIPDVDPQHYENILACFTGGVSFFDCTPDKSFVYEKSTPWEGFEFDTPIGHVIVLVVDASYSRTTVHEYAKKHNLHFNTVMRWCRDQKIPAVKRGKSWVIFDKQ